eukprot:117711_1
MAIHRFMIHPMAIHRFMIHPIFVKQTTHFFSRIVPFNQPIPSTNRSIASQVAIPHPCTTIDTYVLEMIDWEQIVQIEQEEDEDEGYDSDAFDDAEYDSDIETEDEGEEFDCYEQADDLVIPPNEAEEERVVIEEEKANDDEEKKDIVVTRTSVTGARLQKIVEKALEMNGLSTISQSPWYQIVGDRASNNVKMGRLMTMGFVPGALHGLNTTTGTALKKLTRKKIRKPGQRKKRRNKDYDPTVDRVLSQLRKICVAVKNDEDGEESGYFTKKIQDLETERNELKENNEEIQTLNSSLHEANGSNDELRKEIRCMQKEMSRPKEIEGAKKHKKYEEFEALFKEERNKVQELRKERQITAKKTNYVMWRNRTTIRCLIGMMILRFIIKWMMRTQRASTSTPLKFENCSFI